MAGSAVHPLQNTWTIWELKHFQDSSDYSNALRTICEFSTVEDFWKYFIHLPKPSEVFTEGSQKKLVDGRSIKAFGLFKRGIKPEWEDSANQGGCELTAVKSFQFEVLDIYWENLVLGLIGQTLEEGNEICGCRVVDQTKRARPLYKLELWLRVADPPVVNKIKAKLGEILIDGENNKTNRLKAPEFDLVLRK